MGDGVKEKYGKQSRSLTSHNSITASSSPPVFKVRIASPEHAGARRELKEAMRLSEESRVQL